MEEEWLITQAVY